MGFSKNGRESNILITLIHYIIDIFRNIYIKAKMEPTEKHSFHLLFFIFIYDVIDYWEAAK